MNRSTYVHPELRTADHILVSEMVKNANGGLSAQRPTDPGLDLQAKALAEEINEGLKARPVSNRDAFLARANEYKEVAEGLGLKVHAQRLPRFALVDRKMSREFTEKVFEYDTPKTVIPAFPTSFGHHVVWLEAARLPG